MFSHGKKEEEGGEEGQAEDHQAEGRQAPTLKTNFPAKFFAGIFVLRAPTIGTGLTYKLLARIFARAEEVKIMRKFRSLTPFYVLTGMLAAPGIKADCPITLDLRDQDGELPGRPSRKIRDLAGFRIATENARFANAPESRKSGTSFDLVIIPASRRDITIGGFYARRGIGKADLAGTKSLQIIFSAPKQPPSATLSISVSETQGPKLPPRIWTHVFPTGPRLDASKGLLNASFADFRRNAKLERSGRRKTRKADRVKSELDPALISAWEIGFFSEPGRIKLIIHSISFCR